MLNFVEITSNDNWFKKHPEKIAGEEYETTSFYFPIMVKGTKDDVLRVTGMNKNNDMKKLALAKAKAKALKVKLSLGQLGVAKINPAKLFKRIYKKETTLSKKLDSGKFDDSINFSKMKKEQKELWEQMSDLKEHISEDDFYSHLSDDLCCSYEDFKPE